MADQINGCPACGSRARHTFGERVTETRLAWWEAWSCAACGFRSEADGADRLPDELRAEVIASDGSYRVQVVPKDRPAVLRALRNAFGMSLADAGAMLADIPAVVGTQLTKAEATRIANAFVAGIADVRIEPES